MEIRHERRADGDPVEHESEDLGPLFDQWRRIEDLAEYLCEASANREHPGTLGNIADEIVAPLLGRLGWNVEDGSVAEPGLHLTTGAIDFALCVPPGTPRVLVKIGALPGNRDSTTAHPFEDCNPRATQLAVSEDARIWRLHFPAGRGTIHNREFARFELSPESAEGMAMAFDRYLSFHSVESGEAWRRAEREYGERRFAAEAHRAWRRSLLGEEVLRRFEREMEDVIGVAVDGERAKGFVRGRIASMPWPPDPPDPNPARRVAVGDGVWVYDPAPREIVRRRVVDGDPDIDLGEVSRDSPFGHALIGAHEGEERPLHLPGQLARTIRVVLIGDRGG